MDNTTLEQLRSDFDSVSRTLGDGLRRRTPRLVALVAKWQKEDLVPGLSDLDFRVICDDETSGQDWVEVDRAVGEIHLEMVRAHPEWNRINEHTAGAGLTVGEAMDGRFHNPEYAAWSVWWGEEEWYRELDRRIRRRPFDLLDEHYHLSRFLGYYSPYIRGIDPPINLGRFEPKYPLHSRCWHYFAPPMLSAASLLARRNLSGKRRGLSWLHEAGHVRAAVEAVLHQVDSHYETRELGDPRRLGEFEEFLFTAFAELRGPVRESVRHLPLPPTADPAALKESLSAMVSDPLSTLIENVRFVRIRAGRYHFYVNAPRHFEVRELMAIELKWARRLNHGIFSSVRAILEEGGLSPAECLRRLEIEVDPVQAEAMEFMADLSSRTPQDPDLRQLFQEAVGRFPHYYRLLEQSLTRSLERVSRRGA